MAALQNTRKRGLADASNTDNDHPSFEVRKNLWLGISIELSKVLLGPLDAHLGSTVPTKH
jgi:hypothetical protein